MFVRINMYNRLFPLWKSVDYINTSNILRMEVANTKVNIYTVFRPKYSAHTFNFNSNEAAKKFADNCMGIQVEKAVRLDEASPDSLAIAAMDSWEEEKKLA